MELRRPRGPGVCASFSAHPSPPAAPPESALTVCSSCASEQSGGETRLLTAPPERGGETAPLTHRTPHDPALDMADTPERAEVQGLHAIIIIIIIIIIINTIREAPQCPSVTTLRE
ncbi:hypothetical protein SKAU_G00345570 [Synaphobranchus kaupii]|uniref:Uncharacterized protein n=1 Tax=Synaphobranchus kaupii TaxID=118154 RepID=A0A9Q1EJI4_SYNKA|nr:hypothetical protein SKAU_G00345570 [Synaphobranchus kaupii]